MSEEEKPPKGINRRNFLRSAAAVPVAGATGGVGAINAAAGAVVQQGITVALGRKLHTYLCDLGPYLGDFVSDKNKDMLRDNLLGKGQWGRRKGRSDYPQPWADNKVDFSNQRSLLNRLQKMHKGIPVKVLLGDDALKDTLEDSEDYLAERGESFRDFLGPLCDDKTTADDLIVSFHGFFEKLAAHAIKNPNDFKIYGRNNAVSDIPSIYDIAIEDNEIETLVGILKEYESSLGIKTPALETLERVNQTNIQKTKEHWVEYHKTRVEKRRAEKQEERMIEEAREKAYQEDQRRQWDAEEAERLAEPTKRNSVHVSLKHISGDQYSIETAETTRVDWHQWALTINPFAKPHHVRLEEDGRTVTIINTPENLEVLRALFRSNRGDGKFSAEIPNKRMGIDIRAENEAVQKPVSIPMIQSQTNVNLKVDSVVVSASEIFSGNTILGIDFSKASRVGAIDPLTGLNTIEAMKDKLEGNKHQIGGYDAPDDSVTLMHFDISNFKFFNDIFGHETGDFLLQELSNQIKQSTGSYDIVGRVDGDKIAVIRYGLRKADKDPSSEIINKLNQLMPSVITNNEGELETIKFKAQMTQPQSAEIVNFPVSPELKVAA